MSMHIKSSDKAWTEERAIAALKASEQQDEIVPGMRAQAKGQKVFVESDYAPLKGVILGSPYAMYVVDPYYPAMYQSFRSMPKHELKWWSENRGKHFKDADPRLWEAIVEENAALLEVMKEAGVNVIQNVGDNIPNEIVDYVTGWTTPDTKHWNLTAQGLLEVIGNAIVVVHEPMPLNRHAILEYTEALIGLVEGDPNAVWLTMPNPIPTANGGGPGPFLSAGDIRLFPNKLCVVGIGVYNRADINNPKAARSSGNEIGVEILKRMLKPYGWRVETVYFDANIAYHIDCVIAQIKEGLIAYGKQALFTELPKELANWEVLDISYEDYKVGAGNNIILDRNTTIITADAKQLIKDVEARGVDVVPVKFTETYTTTGSGLHCCHASYWREDA